MDISRLNPTPRYADATIFNGLVHAAEVPADAGADITAQCRSMLDLLEQTLRKAGSDKSRLLMVTLYLVDMNDYATMNAVWEAWLPEGCAPARVCVQVGRLASAGLRIEIAVTAARQPGAQA